MGTDTRRASRPCIRPPARAGTRVTGTLLERVSERLVTDYGMCRRRSEQWKGQRSRGGTYRRGYGEGGGRISEGFHGGGCVAPATAQRGNSTVERGLAEISLTRGRLLRVGGLLVSRCSRVQEGFRTASRGKQPQRTQGAQSRKNCSAFSVVSAVAFPL